MLELCLGVHKSLWNDLKSSQIKSIWFDLKSKSLLSDLTWFDLKIGWRPPDLILIWTWNSWLKACLTWWYKIVCLEWLTMIWSDLKVIFSISTWFDLTWPFIYTFRFDLNWFDFFSQSTKIWLDLIWENLVRFWLDLIWLELF